MVAYSFQSRFAPAVESGRKRQTIRAVGKRRHARQGEAKRILGDAVAEMKGRVGHA